MERLSVRRVAIVVLALGATYLPLFASGEETVAVGALINSIGSPRSIAFGDVDGDGDLDMVSCPAWGAHIVWYENRVQEGYFGPQQLVTREANYSSSIALADLDADGDLDVLAASDWDDKVAWFRNTDGAGTFGPKIVLSHADTPWVRAADLNGDGRDDLLVGSGGKIWQESAGRMTIVAEQGGIYWQENLGSDGRFGEIEMIARSVASPRHVIALDLDHDGDLDVVSPSESDDRVTWYANLDGQGNFGAQQVIADLVDSGCCTWSCDWDIYYPTAGLAGVVCGYVLILASFAFIGYRSYREKTTGIPLSGLVALLGAGLIVLPHLPPLNRWFYSGADRLFPPDLYSDPSQGIAWWSHVGLLGILIGQYAIYGKREALTELTRRYFHWIAILIFVTIVFTQWLFILYFEDYFVNEVYPVATLIAAGGYYRMFTLRASRADQEQANPHLRLPGGSLRGLSLLGAWSLALGTGSLYAGTILGGLKAAYHDHVDTGYCLIYWIYAISVLMLVLYALLLTRRWRIMRGSPNRPSL